MQITLKNAGTSLFVVLVYILSGCSSAPKEKADFILYNGTIYTVDSAFSTCEALAVVNGSIVAIGSTDEVLDKYDASKTYNLEGQAVYPGFIDAHSHFFGYGKNLQELDLRKATSLEDMINRTVAYAQQTNPSVIVGRGWNEENWETKGNISKFKLDLLFPATPVFLQRVDGHAALCNQAALDLAGIDENFTIDGGRAVRMGTALTGVLVDKAADLVKDKLPELSLSQKVRALKDAEKNCLAVGLTSVCDAGQDAEIILLMDSLHRNNELKIRIYAMSNPDTNDVLRLLDHDFNNRLIMRSIKLYADGSLGSRGALLKQPYCDDSSTYGLLQNELSYYESMIAFCKNHNLQVNTHCIGDSANKLLLELYASQLDTENDLRWRIEHAQVVDPLDQHWFGDYNIIPSVQPTHATSDALMAQDRLCNSPAMEGAYAYRSLMNGCGMVAFGTDFPVEDIDPLATYFSAVKRKDRLGNVFRGKEALMPKDAITAMTRWAAYANFADQETGTIEVGKKADFTIVSDHLGNAFERSQVKVSMTIVNGEILFTNGSISPDPQTN
jgi:predicted amidohydrolase YtcJ